MSGRNATVSVSNSATDVRKSPFHLNRLADGRIAAEMDDEKSCMNETMAENMLLRVSSIWGTKFHNSIHCMAFIQGPKTKNGFNDSFLTHYFWSPIP